MQCTDLSKLPDLHKNVVSLLTIYIGHTKLLYVPHLQNFKLMARFLDVIDFDSSKIGEDWNFLIYGNYQEYPSSLAPDICHLCLTTFGQIPGGNVRSGCHYCSLDNLKHPYFDCGWPYKVKEILRASDPFMRFHYAHALQIHKKIRETKHEKV